MTVPTKPEDLREETIPHWLAWVETSLGRWRELMPKQDKDLTFFLLDTGRISHHVLTFVLCHVCCYSIKPVFPIAVSSTLGAAPTGFFCA